MIVLMTRGEAEISEFQPSDQDAVRWLILAGLGEHWGHIDETLNPDLDDIGATFRHGTTVVVRSGGEIVATGTVVPRGTSSAEILRMSVATDHRRLGLGRVVVEELLRTARAWGATSVVLETNTSWNDVLAFYRACGFAIINPEAESLGVTTWFRLEL